MSNTSTEVINTIGDVAKTGLKFWLITSLVGLILFGVLLALFATCCYYIMHTDKNAVSSNKNLPFILDNKKEMEKLNIVTFIS